MRLHALQYLRAIAALAVVVSHTAIQVDGYSEFLSEAGSFGVDIFFVISGFIMVYIARPDTRPGAFITARIRRVVPLYWFFTLLMAAILLLLPSAFRNSVFDLDILLMSLAFIPHWNVAHPEHVWPLVAPGWSLVYEMYFYLVFALSLLLAQRFRVPFITTFITVAFILGTMATPGDSAVAAFFAKDMVFEFIFGMFLALAWQRGMQLSSTAAWFLLVFAASLLLLELPAPRIISYGIPSLLVVTACLYIRIGEYRWAVLLGDASYALYLSHIFTLGILRKLVVPVLGEGELAAYLFLLISLVVCTLVGIVVHKYIDNWLLRRERFQFAMSRTAENGTA